MGMIRRILNIGVGLAAGALAYKLLGDYNKTGMVEGEFTVVDHPEEAEKKAEPQPNAEADPEPEPAAAGQPKAAAAGVPLGGSQPLQRDENGHVDPASIADPADFKDWDDMGCRG